MGLLTHFRRPIARLVATTAQGGAFLPSGRLPGTCWAYGTRGLDQGAPIYVPPASALARPMPVASMAELDHLVQLHDAGNLSDEEFVAAKSKLLHI